MLICFVPVLFTFYIQSVLKLKLNSGAKGLKHLSSYFLSTYLYYPSINPLKTKLIPFYFKPQSIPRCKRFSSQL